MNPTDVPAPEASQGSSQQGANMKSETLGLIAKIEAILNEWMIVKAPFQIPESGKEIIAKVTPYLVIVFSILSIPALLAVLGFGAMMAPVAMLSGYAGSGFFWLIGVLASFVALALNVMAIPGLFKRTHASWRLLFYGTLVSFVGSVLSLNLIGAIIGGVISWYILFQVKALYRN